MIGILPAAGKAERIHGLPKYLLPIGDSYLLDIHVKRMLAAGCEDVFVGANVDNRGTIEEYTDAFVIEAEHYATMSETVLSLAHLCAGDHVLFGMPDTYWQTPDVYERLAHTLNNALVAVAVFSARQNQRSHVGMVQFSGKHVIQIVDKPERTNLICCWGALAWRPDFWQYLNPADAHVGFAVQRAIADGLDVRAVYCDGDYWDCGTPDRYFECIRSITGQGQPA